MQPSEDGAPWTELWVTVVVLAHAFAAAFLLPLLWPSLLRPGKQLLLRAARSRSARRERPRPTAAESAAAIPAPAQARLEWHGVGCSYRTPSGPKIVLQGAFGSTGPGDMLALLGPSGSGKTTLLDILALRKTLGDVQGTILLNGQPYSRRAHAHLLAYVPQEEVFPPSLTCEEVLALWCSLSLPPGTGKRQREQRMAEVLAAVGLQGQTKTLVGGALPGALMLRGLSGGERKRLGVATGLLQRPPLIFLDEPTTGLDSRSALNVVQHLSAMAAAGHTIVASIHQPRAAVWALFTHVVVLSQGLMLYAGPRQQLVPWMSGTLGYGPYCPERYGMPADWVMDLVNVGFRKPQHYYGHTMQGVDDLALAAARFAQRHTNTSTTATATASSAATLVTAPTSDTIASSSAADAAAAAAPPAPIRAAAATAVAAEAMRGPPALVPARTSAATSAAAAAAAEGPRAPGTGAAGVSVSGGVKQHQVAGKGPLADGSTGGCGGGVVSCAAEWMQQVRALSWRELVLVTRNPADVAGHALIFCWVGLVIGLVFYAHDSPPLSKVRQYTNAMFVEVAAASLLPYIYMSIHTSDKRFFVADAAAGLYRPGPYYTSKVLVNLPFAVLNALTLSLITYGMAGLSRAQGEWAPALVEHAIMACLSYLIACQVLHFAALFAGSQDAAFMVAIAWTALNLLVSNTLLRFEFLTAHWVASLRYLASMWYVVGGLIRVQFTGREFSCADGLANEYVIRDLIPELLPNNKLLRQSFVQDLSLHPGPSCVVGGADIIAYIGPSLPAWLGCAALLAYLLVLHAATFGALLMTQRRERK